MLVSSVAHRVKDKSNRQGPWPRKPAVNTPISKSYPAPLALLRLQPQPQGGTRRGGGGEWGGAVRVRGARRMRPEDCEVDAGMALKIWLLS